MIGYTYIRQNDEPIQIESVEDEHDPLKDYELSFWWNNKRYYVSDFTRVHNNPWFGSDEGIPGYIHAIETDQYLHPIFIEVVGDDAVNIYEEKTLVDVED